MDHRPQARYTFVLVHGSWCTGAAWDGVARCLRTDGHTVHTPTTAGHGPGADTSLSHADQVRSITGYITKNRLTDIVLVGHSYAGTIISQVAQTMPKRIRRLVFQSAFVPLDQSCIMDEVPLPLRTAIRQGAKNGAFLPPFPLWREMFIGDADVCRAKAVYSTLCPEPMSSYEDRLDQRAFFDLVQSGALACSYLTTPDDNSLPGGWLRFADRLGTVRLVQMPGSHELMFVNPAGLARALVAAGRD